MKQIFLILASTTLAIVANVARARPLVVYSPHGPEVLRLAKAEMQKLDPSFEIDWQFMGAEELYQKVKAERADPKADIWWGGPQFTFMQAAKEDLLTPYRGVAADKIGAVFRDPKDLWLGDMQTPLTIVYNKELVTMSNRPKDWNDLLNPAFKGKLVVRHPMSSGSMRALYSALIDRQLSAGNTLDGALAWMKKLHEQVARYETHSQKMFTSIGKGLMLFGLWNLPEIAMKARQGYPVAHVLPSSGLPVLVDCIALTKRAAEHPAARRFYDFVTSAAFARKLTAEPFNRVPTRNDLPADVRPSYIEDPRYKVMPVDWQRIAVEGDGWMKRWASEVGPDAERKKP